MATEASVNRISRSQEEDDELVVSLRKPASCWSVDSVSRIEGSKVGAHKADPAGRSPIADLLCVVTGDCQRQRSRLAGKGGARGQAQGTPVA
jgi:hypothetical protein